MSDNDVELEDGHEPAKVVDSWGPWKLRASIEGRSEEVLEELFMVESN